MHAEYCNYCSIAIFLAFNTLWTSKQDMSYLIIQQTFFDSASKGFQGCWIANAVKHSRYGDSEFDFPLSKTQKIVQNSQFTTPMSGSCWQNANNLTAIIDTSAQQDYNSWHIDSKCKTWYYCTNLCIMPYHCVMYIQGGIRQRLFNAGQPVSPAVSRLFWIHTLQVKPITLANCAD